MIENELNKAINKSITSNCLIYTVLSLACLALTKYIGEIGYLFLIFTTLFTSVNILEVIRNEADIKEFKPALILKTAFITGVLSSSVIYIMLIVLPYTLIASTNQEFINHFNNNELLLTCTITGLCLLVSIGCLMASLSLIISPLYTKIKPDLKYLALWITPLSLSILIMILYINYILLPFLEKIPI